MEKINTSQPNIRPQPDKEMVDIAEYVADYRIVSEEAFSTARYVLMDSMGCAILALRYPECAKLIGPAAPGASVPLGARVPGTGFELDPVKAAFDTGTLVRWLDFNDAFLAAEWNHPSDNLGGILAVSDYVSRRRLQEGQLPLTMRDVLVSMIKAHEIQGVMALENSFNRVGLDHVLLVKVATAAVTTSLMGGDRQKITDSVSQAWIDGPPLRIYRHAPNTGTRKSWAAGDATSRGVWLSLLTMKGEMGYPGALTAKGFGFYDVFYKGQRFKFQRPYGTYVMENVLFKVAFPAEFHAQTAVECALSLHNSVRGRIEDIKNIEITTQEPAIRIISKTGPLHNPADRDHCIQYMVAASLIYGELTADHYKEPIASNPMIDELREKTEVAEDKRYTREYLEPGKRSVANAVQVFFRDGSSTAKVEIEYPLGHPRRRAEGIPLLINKFRRNCGHLFVPEKVDSVVGLFLDPARLHAMTVPDFMELFAGYR